MASGPAGGRCRRDGAGGRKATRTAEPLLRATAASGGGCVRWRRRQLRWWWWRRRLGNAAGRAVSLSSSPFERRPWPGGHGGASLSRRWAAMAASESRLGIPVAPGRRAGGRPARTDPRTQRTVFAAGGGGDGRGRAADRFLGGRSSEQASSSVSCSLSAVAAAGRASGCRHGRRLMPRSGRWAESWARVGVRVTGTRQLGGWRSSQAGKRNWRARGRSGTW